LPGIKEKKVINVRGKVFALFAWTALFISESLFSSSQQKISGSLECAKSSRTKNNGSVYPI